MNITPGQIAARTVNAHPWLSATTPDVDDTDLIIAPANPLDHPDGHVEGHVTWNTTSTGTVAYLIALAYEIAKLMDRLHTWAHGSTQEEA